MCLSPNTSLSQKEQGQTLFELTITLAILSLLGGLSVQGMQHLIKKERGRVAINRLLIATQETRHLALSGRKIMTLCPTQSGTTCDGQWNNRLVIINGRPDNESAVVVSSFGEIDKGRVEWRSFRKGNFLQMQGNGLTLGQNGTFIYCPVDNDIRYAHALIVNKSGRARVAEDLDGDGIRDLRKGEPVSCN